MTAPLPPPSAAPMPFTVHQLSSTAVSSKNPSVHDITDHAKYSRKHVPPPGANPTTSRPPQFKPRRLRATYAWATGLNTTLHYPHEFHVSLKGTPVVDPAGQHHIPALSADLGPSAAISAVLDSISDISKNPKSFCGHSNCIYNKGDLITRRNRHLLSIRYIDSQLGRPATTQSTVSYERKPDSKPQGRTSTCLVLSSGSSRKTVLDSGASRHIEADPSQLTNLRRCRAVVLQGINGDSIRIDTHGNSGHCNGVLLAPSASASVRSVSALIDSHECHIVFTPNGAFLTSSFDIPPGSTFIAKRKEDGLFHLVPGAIPPPPPSASAHAFLSVPQQIKREAVHRLHRLLAHASPKRMRQVLTSHPELFPSLKPIDTRLFTTCDACGMGNARRPSPPEKASVRATSVGYRIHLDTSGTIRPSTTSGFTRVLIAVDDASRWIFITLLRNATMHVVAAAMRAILRKIAGDHSVLRTKYVRTDNGTEFCNRVVDALLAESDIMRELTCVGTSHQNGVAERAIGVVFAIARTIIIDAHLPPRFWGEAVITAVYVRNRLPCSANPDHLSPYEVRYGRRPDIRHLRPFGVTAFVRTQAHITKVQPRAYKGIMIGYGASVSGQKGWRIFIPNPPRVVTTTAVTFADDLAHSVSSRDPSLVSNVPPIFIPNDPTSPTRPNPSSGLPLSLQAPPPGLPPRSNSTTRVAPTVTSKTPARAPTSSSPVITTPYSPRAITSAPPRRPAPNTATPKRAVITSPATPLPGEAPPLHTATVRRPRGRAPRGCRWDKHAGRYVAALAAPATTLPNYHQVWCTVADSCPSPVCPSSYHQAVNGPDKEQWADAIKSEFDSLHTMKTWKVINRSDMPPKAVPIKTKWVFKLKRNESNVVVRFKARLTACGYAQRYGRDYNETYSPVASAASIRFIFALAASRNLFLDQHDIRTAFLYGVLPENQRVYLRVPEGLNLSPDHVLCCLRGIYGLKQSCRLFNIHLNRGLGSIGYTPSM